MRCHPDRHRHSHQTWRPLNCQALSQIWLSDWIKIADSKGQVKTEVVYSALASKRCCGTCLHQKWTTMVVRYTYVGVVVWWWVSLQYCRTAGPERRGPRLARNWLMDDLAHQAVARSREIFSLSQFSWARAERDLHLSDLFGPTLLPGNSRVAHITSHVHQNQNTLLKFLHKNFT